VLRHFFGKLSLSGDSLLQAARESVSDKVMLVVKQSARLLSRPKAKPP
jgi:hypothetical protein